MSRKRWQRGEGQFGCLVGLVVLAIAGLIAYRLIPVKVKTAELRDTVIDEARSAGQRKDKQIKATILSQAKRLDLPLTEEGIDIRRTRSYIYVDVKYTVPVEFPGYVHNWDFHHHVENPVF